jgi:predicted ArsR family transcriptional regulator
MVNARHKILTYLHKARTGSAREISRALKMPAANVRHHLRVLASDGRLEVVSKRGREGRGRPEKVYSLPRTALGDNLAGLAGALLQEVGPGMRVEALAKFLAGGESLAAQPIAKRLNLIVEKLIQMNYHARWEAGAAGPRIIFSHCPYAAIIENHPELCRMDRALLRAWMGQPVEQIFKQGTQGSSVCVFAIGS